MGWLESAIDIGKDVLSSNKGKIASGIAGAVLGSGSKKSGAGESTSGTTSGSTITQMPAWMNDYARQLMTQQTNLSNQGHIPYNAAQVAEMSPDQQAAAGIVRGNTGQAGAVITDAMGNYNPNAGTGMLAKAGNYLDNAGKSWLDPGVSENYMTDFQAHVTNPAVSQAMRTWNEQINPGIQGTFAGSKGVGAFGSDAMARTMANAGVDLSTKLGESMAGYLNTGYSQGMGQHNTENTQRGQLATIAGNLGTTEAGMAGDALNNQIRGASAWQGANAADVSALQNVGAQQQAIDQKKLDVARTDWDDANAYSQNQIKQGAGLLGQLAGNVDKSVVNSSATTGAKQGTNYVDPLTGAIQGMEQAGQWGEILGTLGKNTGVVGPKMDPRQMPTGGPTGKPTEITEEIPGDGWARGGRVPGGMLRRLAESDRRARGGRAY
jgi:hypothetical protein